MVHASSQFQELIDSIESMPDEDQTMLVTIIQKRLEEKRRELLVHQIHQSETDFKNSEIKTGTVSELLEDIQSCQDEFGRNHSQKCQAILETTPHSAIQV